MRNLLLRRPSPALVVSCVALVVALGGTSYAAFSLPKNSVGSEQLKSGAVTTSKIKNGAVPSSKIKNGAVTSSKIKNGAVTSSKINAAGLTVPHATTAANANALGGRPASAFAGAEQWALVQVDGTIDSQSGGISMTAHSAGGYYYLDFGRNVSGRAILVSLNGGNNATTFYYNGQVTVAPCGGADTDPVRTHCYATGTNDSNHVFVETTDATGGPSDRPFYIVIPG
jgi:hypothetical protein